MWNTVNPINPIHGHTWNGIPTVRKGEGLAGKGTKRKRMPICNGLDRGYYKIYSSRYPTQKGADFESGRD